ncbi:protein NLP7-like isoform X2 [Lycium barbarum]|uniref:protein NLP7-like isoform X2 n=1 Tax=Lycium barbarum TaxID=112863 RepID=UPI00293E0484|nr:protein NLP7-like isoform X2 [Lycium barbarum]
MGHLQLQESGEFHKPSNVSDLMPCELVCKSQKSFNVDSHWVFWSSRPNAELNYQRMIFPMIADCPVVPSCKGFVKERIKSILEKILSKNVCLLQLWAPIKVNGWSYLSTADQPFALCDKLDKGLCSYRRLRLDTLIPIDINNVEVEGLLGPIGREFRSGLLEFSPDVRSYSAGEFPLLEAAIRLGIRRYWAWPLFKPLDQHCLGVLEIAFTDPTSYSARFLKEMDMRCSEINGLFYPKDTDSQPSEWDNVLGAPDQIEAGLHVVCKIHNIPFAQIWIPRSQSCSINAQIATGRRSFDSSSSIYDEFADASDFCYIQRGKALVGRAFSTQGSCFCKDVTLLSLTEYPLVPSARKARLTQSFAICLQSKSANNIIYVVEFFLPPNEIVVSDTMTLLNMLLSTMKEQLPGVIVASGQELG